MSVISEFPTITSYKEAYLPIIQNVGVDMYVNAKITPQDIVKGCSSIINKYINNYIQLNNIGNDKQIKKVVQSLNLIGEEEVKQLINYSLANYISADSLGENTESLKEQIIKNLNITTSDITDNFVSISNFNSAISGLRDSIQKVNSTSNSSGLNESQVNSLIQQALANINGSNFIVPLEAATYEALKILGQINSNTLYIIVDSNSKEIKGLKHQNYTCDFDDMITKKVNSILNPGSSQETPNNPNTNPEQEEPSNNDEEGE